MQKAKQRRVAVDENISNSQFRFYTRLKKTVFQVCVLLAVSLAKASFVMPVEDQILLTLMQLCMGLLLIDLASSFRVSTALVSNIFSFWVSRLAQVSRKYLMFWLPLKRFGCHWQMFPKTCLGLCICGRLSVQMIGCLALKTTACKRFSEPRDERRQRVSDERRKPLTVARSVTRFLDF